MFDCRSVCQFFVVTAILIYDIEVQHPQVGHEPAKVGVQDKADKAKDLQLRSQLNDRGDRQRSGSGIHADAVRVLNQIAEVDRHTLTRMSSTSVCGTRNASITSLIEAVSRKE